MTARDINENALNFLMKQNWARAQQLFFENAKKNPSHETYNNLGNYLINEGLLCKNGRVRNAQKLGLKYLLRAAEIKDSQVNLCAISKAYDYELRTAIGAQRQTLYEQSYRCLEKALKIKYSDEIQYNLLRILCLMNARDDSVLEKVGTFVENYICKESVSLYLELLCIHLLLDEGLHCIERYREYLTEIDLLMFCAKFELYEKGYHLCETICNQFSPDKYVASAIIECCVNTHHFEQAKIYAQHIKELEDDIQYVGKETWCEKIFCNMDSSDKKRKKLIAEYLSIPPFIESCYYYGCTVHGINW